MLPFADTAGTGGLYGTVPHFSSPAHKRSSLTKCFPQEPVFQLPPCHRYFMDGDHTLVSSGHIISGAAFASPPAPSPQPHPTLPQQKEGWMHDCLIA